MTEETIVETEETSDMHPPKHRKRKSKAKAADTKKASPAKGTPPSDTPIVRRKTKAKAKAADARKSKAPKKDPYKDAVDGLPEDDGLPENTPHKEMAKPLPDEIQEAIDNADASDFQDIAAAAVFMGIDEDGEPAPSEVAAALEEEAAGETEEVKDTAVNDIGDIMDLDIRSIPVDDIEANDYNPNAMETELFDILVNTVRDDGKMVQPILVIPNPNLEDDPESPPFMVVDGEHRWKASREAGLDNVVAIVADYDPTAAQLRTVAMNNLRGNYIPLKMAKLLAKLQDEDGYSQEEIRRMTGIKEDEFATLADLLDVPDIDFGDDEISVSLDEPERPVFVNLALMPNEYSDYNKAMVQAMELAGPMVVPLLGDQIKDYHDAMTRAMDLAGVKQRNIGMATVCRVFNHVMGVAVNGKVKGNFTLAEVIRESTDKLVIEAATTEDIQDSASVVLDEEDMAELYEEEEEAGDEEISVLSGDLEIFDLSMVEEVSECLEVIEEWEEEFPEPLRTSSTTYLGLIEQEKSVCLYAVEHDTDIPVGYVFAAPLYNSESNIAEMLKEEQAEQDKLMVSPSTIYSYTVFVDEAYRKRGYGRLMVQEMYRMAAELGFKFVARHSRQNGMSTLASELKPVKTFDVEDWQGSGETFTYFRSRLPKVEK